MGAITNTFHFDGYGMDLGWNRSNSVEFNQVNRPATDMLYSGEQYDTPLQMQYLRARYYDQNVGGFNRLDPYSGSMYIPQSFHKYAYVHNDPTTAIDPSGQYGDQNLLSLTMGSSLSISLGAYWGVAAVAAGAAGLITLAVLQSLVLANPISIDWPDFDWPDWNLGDRARDLERSIRSGVRRGWDWLMSRLSQLIRYVKNVIRQIASATASAVWQLSRLPIYWVIEAVTPQIYAFDLNYLALNPAFHLLNYNGPNSPITRRNRAWVRRTYRNLRVGAPPLTSLDEYPYASTQQGGSPFAAAHMAPVTEQIIQGTTLSLFYRRRGYLAGMPFLVIPIPISLP